MCRAVIMVGDYATGKTSLIRRYTEGHFTPGYKLTIGVDFACKVRQLCGGRGCLSHCSPLRRVCQRIPRLAAFDGGQR